MFEYRKGASELTRRKYFYFCAIICGFYLYQPAACESNLALGKAANQSSTVHDKLASLAVDGNTNNKMEAGSCSQTSNQKQNGYWVVDLADTFAVTTVNITMRAGCCDSRFETAAIYITNMSYSQPAPGIYDASEKCRDIKDISITGLPLGQTTSIACLSPKHGQFVYIQNTGAGAISLCEVEVYGLQGNRSTPTTTSASTTEAAAVTSSLSTVSSTVKSYPTTAKVTPYPTRVSSTVKSYPTTTAKVTASRTTVLSTVKSYPTTTAKVTPHSTIVTVTRQIKPH